MISIIVPHYCTPKEYFDKCMHSLLNNKDADIEVLIIDDGSPADYLDHLNEYTSDQRVKVFHEEHKGVSNARNVGISKAHGDWLMFVDSDDYLADGYYATLERTIEKYDADVIIFNGFGDKDGKSVRNEYCVKENVDYGASIEMKCQLMASGLSLGRIPEYHRCFYSLGAPYSKLISTSYIHRKGVLFDDDVKFAEDTLFSLNLYLQADHIYYVDEYLYHYYMNEYSVTGKYRKGLSVDMNVFFSTVNQFITVYGLQDSLSESYYIRAFLEAQRSLRQEFFHKDNVATKAEKHRSAKGFLEQEPFIVALNSEYPYLKTKTAKIATWLLHTERYDLYMRMYSCLAFVRRICRGPIANAFRRLYNNR